jgi:viologen exporter family transport system ATP-binding protein
VTDPIIQADHLVKTFRTPRRHGGRFGAIRTLFSREYDITTAVADVSLAIEPGELVGYLGPNGAGKSTTIKMLTGILVPTSGSLRVAGRVPSQQRVQMSQDIGVVFGQRSQLWWDLPLIESFDLVARMYGVPIERFRSNLAHFREILGLDEFITTPVRQLSLGQRMRGDLTAALLHDPKTVYLDEPTVGLDVFAKERIRVFIEQINRERQTTVLLTTHDLADVERLCPRIILIDHGRVLFDGSVVDLTARFAPNRVLVVRLAEEVAATRPNEDIELPGVSVARRADGGLAYQFDPATVSAPDLISAVAARYAISDLTIEEPDLETVIRAMYASGEGRP